MVVLYNIGYVVSMKKIYMLPKIALSSPNHIKKTTTMPLKPIKKWVENYFVQQCAISYNFHPIVFQSFVCDNKGAGSNRRFWLKSVVVVHKGW